MAHESKISWAFFFLLQVKPYGEENFLVSNKNKKEEGSLLYTKKNFLDVDEMNEAVISSHSRIFKML
ncbi:MAG: hypothetical protein COX62_05295 [Deltaproteobacteria bacterium CG_4_10_14_0_2_um_filter_43_8]|nr:MAG: hypothetical protein COV43_02830 [Deltaproteobacteria bacterium CG11_big_fil_rev_8_21_14_0_20_42_23]PJA20135.1 MAG: hypothetical protein COX62_05295 [Deltaproteobacteria bacterium CG_4_10_14_0_2_um_filter_43_8]PJC64422.1 MAG: hypothetical protein CO021_04390 [Deltaproteobacteria bacterium CG_4_9_14_0_2_um_filter_42_21]